MVKAVAIILSLMLISPFGAQPIFAQNIAEVGPTDVPSLVDATTTGRPLVVHYTSDDGSCGHCVKNNVIVEDAAQRLSDNFTFVSVTMNPWRQFFDASEGQNLIDFQESQGFPLSGVPAVMVFANGQPIRMYPGANPALISSLEQAFEVISDQELVVRGDVSVAHIPPSQLEAYVAAFSANQPLLLTVSSTDVDCSHCITGNAAVDDVSRYLANDYAFARLDYNPWRSFQDDTQTTRLLAQYDVELGGLPTSLLFYKGKLMGTVTTNGQDLRTVLSQALPAIKSSD